MSRYYFGVHIPDDDDPSYSPYDPKTYTLKRVSTPRELKDKVRDIDEELDRLRRTPRPTPQQVGQEIKAECTSGRRIVRQSIREIIGTYVDINNNLAELDKLARRHRYNEVIEAKEKHIIFYNEIKDELEDILLQLEVLALDEDFLFTELDCINGIYTVFKEIYEHLLGKEEYVIQ